MMLWLLLLNTQKNHKRDVHTARQRQTMQRPTLLLNGQTHLYRLVLSHIWAESFLFFCMCFVDSLYRSWSWLNSFTHSKMGCDDFAIFISELRLARTIWMNAEQLARVIQNGARGKTTTTTRTTVTTQCAARSLRRTAAVWDAGAIWRRNWVLLVAICGVCYVYMCVYLWRRLLFYICWILAWGSR